MRNPDQAESRVCVFTREMAKSLRFSPYRLRDNAEKDGKSQMISLYIILISVLTASNLVGISFLSLSSTGYTSPPLDRIRRYGLVHGQVQTKEITQRAQPERRTVGVGEGFLPETDLGDVL